MVLVVQLVGAVRVQLRGGRAHRRLTITAMECVIVGAEPLIKTARELQLKLALRMPTTGHVHAILRGLTQ